MLSSLFEEDNSTSTVYGPWNKNESERSAAPLPPRHACGLCGIYNQGATCYMNSLLQTLLMTPDFRESLFQLGPKQLGILENQDKKGAKVRIIPIQLQRLFCRLLLLQVQGVSTTELTDSFGWKNREEVIQHDAQELNRILFSAVEDSLVGTCGENLIKDLYHGTIVNQISCDECGRVSEREEDFLDVCVTVTGNSSLQEGLTHAFVNTESLDGHNKYKCDRCKKLVNAKKGAKVRHLPPILTLSLLRFSFDYVKLERFKETGKFSFPLELDMTAYCDNTINRPPAQYELFSVVIHKGSTHGGHYHAYIRDIDNLGNWTHPDVQEIYLPTDPETGKVDFIEFDSPIELVQAILMKHTEDGMGVDKLCAELVKQTGVSWNKRFKKQFGAINKFLKKYDDKFVFNPVTNWVSLKSYQGETLLELSVRHESSKTIQQQTDQNSSSVSRTPSPPPEVGHRWFDFDDSRVSPIRVQQIEKQFSGKESAYMLFYRSKSLKNRGAHENSDPLSTIPEKIVQEVMEENDKLAIERYEFEMKMNTIVLEVHFAQFYTYENGAIKSLTDGGCHLDLDIDRRLSVAELKSEVAQLGGELMCDNFVISVAKQLPAGIHLYQCLTDQMDKTIQSVGLGDKDSIFLWDGERVGKDYITTGEESEPVYLNITYGNPDQLSRGFPKNMTLSEVKLVLMDLTGKDIKNHHLSRIVTKGENTQCFEILPEEEGKTLKELKLENGDQIVCEDSKDTEHLVAKKAVYEQTSHMAFIVELKCKTVGDDGNFTVVPVTVSKDICVAELKGIVISQEQIDILEQGGRLRVDDSNLGLRTPLHEEQTISDAGLKQGMKLILEHGQAPSTNQITLNFTVASEEPYYEIMVDRSMTVQKCLVIMLQKAGLKDDNWHLRKTNCFHEATHIMDDLDITLEQSHLQDGDLVLVEQGKLPPKGFIKLPVRLLPYQGHVDSQDGITSWLIGGVKGLFSGSTKEHSYDSTNSHIDMGEIIMSKEATLLDLKIQIMTLPAMSDFTIPMVEFLRVRLIENGRPTTVLKDLKTSLQRLKLNGSSQLGVQILHHEEVLNSNQVLISVMESKDNHEYGPDHELVWDVTRAGATPQALKQAVADLLVKPVEQIVIAKHFPEKYEWMVFFDTPQKSQKQGKGKSKCPKVNIRHAPYHLKDGDEIGVKNLGQFSNNKDEFCTQEDFEGKLKAKKEAEEKKNRRSKMREQNAAMDLGGGGDASTKRRQEVGIKIHVDDFR